MKENQKKKTNVKESIPENNPQASNLEVIHANVLPWMFGAKVEYLQDGKSMEECFCIPPLVGRFDVGTYNNIVRQINLNTDHLQQKPPS